MCWFSLSCWLVGLFLCFACVRIHVSVRLLWLLTVSLCMQVPFEEALDQVRMRDAYIQDGFVYAPDHTLVSRTFTVSQFQRVTGTICKIRHIPVAR